MSFDQGESMNSSEVKAPVDISRVTESVGDDPDFMAQLYGTYMTDVAERVGELREFLDKRDAESLRHVAHAVKGASANIGAATMRELGAELEALGKAGDLSAAPGYVERITTEFGAVREYLQEYLRSVGRPASTA